MAGKLPFFDYATCMACGACDRACPLSCIALGKLDVDAYKKAYPLLAPDSRCNGCGICQKVCPVDSIVIQSA
jgi:NADH-quinone oxidoreductase subunit I